MSLWYCARSPTVFSPNPRALMFAASAGAASICALTATANADDSHGSLRSKADVDTACAAGGEAATPGLTAVGDSTSPAIDPTDETHRRTGGTAGRSRYRPAGLTDGDGVRYWRGHVARRAEGCKRLQADGFGVPYGERPETEQLLYCCRDRRVFELSMVDHVLRAPRRNHNRWNARPILIEHEAETPALDVLWRCAGRNALGGRWRYVVEETAMLIPGEDQHALVPVRRISDRFVDCFDQCFAELDTIGRMLCVVHERKSQCSGKSYRIWVL